MKEIIAFILLAVLQMQNIYGQVSESMTVPVDTTQMLCHHEHFNCRQLVIPTLMIGTGVLGLTSDWVETKNHPLKDNLVGDRQHTKIKVDGYTEYLPVATVYALNLCGIKGEHSMRDYTVIAVTSLVMESVTTEILKRSIYEKRPDETDNRSFPSGHTAMAFMGAELLRHEYRDVSPWIGVAGYAVATGTGFLRIYNNRHWLTDVIAGAGIGILSAKASYRLFPYISRKLLKKKPQSSAHCLANY